MAVTISRVTARIIDRVYLPLSVNRFRGHDDVKAAIIEFKEALANRDAPGSGSSAKADTDRAADGAVLECHRLLDVWGDNWIIAKGRLTEAEPPYGCQLMVGDTVAAEGEGATLLDAIRQAFGDPEAPAINTTAGEAG
jgi:hypothetical protein